MQETVYNCHDLWGWICTGRLVGCWNSVADTEKWWDSPRAKNKCCFCSCLNPVWTTMKRFTVHSSTGGPFTFMCNCLLQSIRYVGEIINKQKKKKMQILYVPQYSEKKMYYEINKIRKLKIVFCLLVFSKKMFAFTLTKVTSKVVNRYNHDILIY